MQYNDIYTKAIENCDLSIKYSKVLHNFHTCRSERLKLSIQLDKIYNEYILLILDNESEKEYKKMNKKEIKEIHKKLKSLMKKSDNLNDIKELLMLLLLKLKLSLIEVYIILYIIY